jgi:hypothetical protein
MDAQPVKSTDAICGQPGAIVETDIPARLDRLPWGRFHTLVVTALGITWILDGLEVTLAGAVSGALKEDYGLGLSTSEIGLAAQAPCPALFSSAG